MSSRKDFFDGQRVTEGELDSAFDDLERADHNVVADLGFVGVVLNGAVSQHAPVPDLTVDVSGPAVIYDQAGRRIFFSSLQNANVAQDDNGVSTEVATTGNEKIVSVFVRFDRVLSDPRIDRRSLTVFFRRDEGFRFVVAQGGEAPAGAALPPPLRSDAILLADVTRRFGQARVVNADISIARRQDAFVVVGSPRSLRRGRTIEAIADLLAFLNAHTGGSTDRHPAGSIDYAGGAPWADGTPNPPATVEGQLDKMIADLAAPTGAPKIGAAATAGAPNALVAGTVKSQLDALLSFVNGHINRVAGAHAASAISYAGGGAWADGVTNPATTVEAQLDKLVADLAAATGAPKIGAAVAGGAPHALTAGSVKTQLDQLLGHLNGHANAASGAHVATAITCAAGPDWLGGRPNPVVSVQAQLDKIINDLAAQLVGDDGAERIGAQAVVGTPSSLPAGSVRSQLDQLLAFTNASARTNVAQTWTAPQTFNGAGGDTSPSLLVAVDPSIRKLVLEVGVSLRHRLYYTDNRLELVVNARWTGSMWERDSTLAFAARYVFERNDFRVQHVTGAIAQPFSEAAWEGPDAKAIVWDLASGLNFGETVRIGREHEAPGPLTGMSGVEAEWSPNSTANIGAAASFASGRLPAAPSSVTFTVLAESLTDSSPAAFVADRTGASWFDQTLQRASPTTKFMYVAFAGI